jgi:Putative helicase
LTGADTSESRRRAARTATSCEQSVGLLIRRSLVRAQVEEPKKASQIKALQRCKAFFHGVAAAGYWKSIGSVPISSTHRTITPGRALTLRPCPFSAAVRHRQRRGAPPLRQAQGHFRVVDILPSRAGNIPRALLYRAGETLIADLPLSSGEDAGELPRRVVHATLESDRIDQAGWHISEITLTGTEACATVPWLKVVCPEWVLDTEALRDLNRAIDSLRAPFAQLVHNVFCNDVDTRAFLRVPGSLAHHHAEAGGLLVHTVEVVRNVERLLRPEHQIDRDVLITGWRQLPWPAAKIVDAGQITAAILHDVGKAQEYCTGGDGRSRRSSAGNLLLHKQLGKTMFDLACARTGLDSDIALAIGHCLVAADGPQYMGLPNKRLQEATLLGLADSASAKLGSSSTAGGWRRAIG